MLGGEPTVMETQEHGAPHPRRVLPSLPVTRTKRLVASIWHLATLTRLQGSMEVRCSPLLSTPLPTLSSPPLPSLCGFGFQLGGDLRPQYPAGAGLGWSPICLSAYPGTELLGAPEKGQGGRGGGQGQFPPPCRPSPGPGPQDASR